MKPLIVIPGWKVGDNSFGVTSTYLQFASKFGHVRIAMPDDPIIPCDLLLLPGGLDVNPSTFGVAPTFFTSNTDVHKQYFVDNKLKDYIESGTPVFGICLGFQQLAAKFGVKVNQHFYFHPQSKERYAEAHDVWPTDAAQEMDLFKIVKRKAKDKEIEVNSFKVNSHHHQGVLRSDFLKNKRLIELAAAYDYDSDGKDVIVESFMHDELPVAGVQWHPEEHFDDFSEKLIKQLISRSPRMNTKAGDVVLKASCEC